MQRVLTAQGFEISASTLNKYEMGVRAPTGEFVGHLTHCLGLDETERALLYEAARCAITAKFTESYRQTLAACAATDHAQRKGGIS